MTKKVLILGISGQDGSYLAKHLLDQGCEVHGTSRDVEMMRGDNLGRLGIVGDVQLHSMSPTDFQSVYQIMRMVKPEEVYNLAAQSSVGLSFEQPGETLNSTIQVTLNILEILRTFDPSCRFYNAASSEIFGNIVEGRATEETRLQPRSPYGVGKAAAYWAVANYREAYGLFACSGILFNHESPLRPRRFVTQKIIQGAVDIAAGKQERLKLGNLSIARDWGWAPDFVRAMPLMLRTSSPDDFVIATGECSTLEKFVEYAFSAVGLNWRDHVDTDPSFLRPTDIARSAGDPGKAERELGWKADLHMPAVVEQLIEAELKRRGKTSIQELRGGGAE